MSATELAAKLASGEISAVNAIESCIERIERLDAALNAVVVRRFDAARAEAAAADSARAAGAALGPLDGLPITSKEQSLLERRRVRPARRARSRPPIRPPVAN